MFLLQNENSKILYMLDFKASQEIYMFGAIFRMLRSIASQVKAVICSCEYSLLSTDLLDCYILVSGQAECYFLKGWALRVVNYLRLVNSN